MQFKAVMLVDSPQSQNGRGRGASQATALEHVANRPILHHVLDSLVEASVEAVVVAGEADVLIDVRACVRDYGTRIDRVEYAPCRGGADLANTLRVLAPLVGSSPCLIHPADGLLDAPVTCYLDLLERGAPDLVLLVAPDGENAADAVKRTSLGPDALTDDSHGIADIGVFASGALARAADAVRGIDAADLAVAGRRFAADGANVLLHPVDGWCRYRGHGSDLLELNRVALDRLAPDAPGLPGTTNRLEGRVLIDPTATVLDSVIIGPAVIGPGATVKDSYIGPYTSIGAGARIEGTEIERSIVASGASVMHVGGRLGSSLVGRDARVFRDFSLPRALRLWVGDGDEVALC